MQQNKSAKSSLLAIGICFYLTVLVVTIAQEIEEKIHRSCSPVVDSNQ